VCVLAEALCVCVCLQVLRGRRDVECRKLFIASESKSLFSFPGATLEYCSGAPGPDYLQPLHSRGPASL
jgi:hypothetical protein